MEALKIFLSSPGDVKQLRNEADNVIRAVAQVCGDKLNLYPTVVRWEHLIPQAPTEKTIQETINKVLLECDIFVLILHKRYGT